MKLTMTTKEAAEYMGVSQQTLKKWLKEGKMEYYDLKYEKTFYIPIVELDRFKSHMIQERPTWRS